MSKKINKKGLVLYSQSKNVAEAVVVETGEACGIDWELRAEPELSKEDLKPLLQSYDFSVLCDQYTYIGPSAVQRRSVGSHFLQYIDLVVREQDQVWGYSVFSQAYREVLLNSIQNQDFKGPVIFLGTSPLALPIIEILATFGFDDFVFLTLENEQHASDELMKSLKGILGVSISSVDSTAFIQSQKEYSFCFVMSADYPRQTLEDMSYFHFLSSKSMVFNAIGESNFLFKEIRALEVSITEFQTILGFWMSSLKKTLSDLPQK